MAAGPPQRRQVARREGGGPGRAACGEWRLPYHYISRRPGPTYGGQGFSNFAVGAASFPFERKLAAPRGVRPGWCCRDSNGHEWGENGGV